MTSTMSIKITCQDIINQLQEAIEEGRLMSYQEAYQEASAYHDNNDWYIFDKPSKPYDYDYSIGYWFEYQEGRIP